MKHLYFIEDMLEHKSFNYSPRQQSHLHIRKSSTTIYGLNSLDTLVTRKCKSLPNDLRLIDLYKHFRRVLHVWDRALELNMFFVFGIP